MKNTKFADLVLNGRYGRRFVLILVDMACFVAMDVFYYLVALHAGNSMPVYRASTFLVNSVLHLAFLFVFRVLFGTYRNVWRILIPGLILTW